MQKQTFRKRRQWYPWILYIKNAFFSIILEYLDYAYIKFLDNVNNLKS